MTSTFYAACTDSNLLLDAGGQDLIGLYPHNPDTNTTSQDYTFDQVPADSPYDCCSLCGYPCCADYVVGFPGQKVGPLAFVLLVTSSPFQNIG